MSCNHKWVNYQPLVGEAYECCANAGCGIKKSDTLEESLGAFWEAMEYTNKQAFASAAEALKENLLFGTPLTDDQLCFDLSDDEEY